MTVDQLIRVLTCAAMEQHVNWHPQHNVLLVKPAVKTVCTKQPAWSAGVRLGSAMSQISAREVRESVLTTGLSETATIAQMELNRATALRDSV